MVVVNGDIENVQSSLDFYLKITSCDSDLSDESLQKKFFAIFDKEDNERSENFLQYQEEVLDDYDIDYTEDLVLMEGEELFDGSFNFFSSKKEEKEEEILDFEDEDLNPEEEFSGWGEDDEEVVEDGWGTYGEEEVGTKDEENSEDDVEGSWYSGAEEEYEELKTEDKEEKIVEDLDDLDDDLVIQPYIEVDDEDSVEEIHKKGKVVKKKDDIVREKVKDLDFDEILMKDDEEELPKNKVIEEIKKPIEEQRVTYEEVPRDLREFVRKYPNCEVSFALKYFTRKEIDLQLSKGRVFKRKGKLLI